MTESVDYLTLEDVLLVARFALPSVEVRDLGLLASAVARPQASAFGADAYPRLAEKAAAMLHSLVRNHAMIDGNKRLAWVATRAFLRLNGLDLRMAEDAAYDMVIAAAEGRLDVPELAGIIGAAMVGASP